MSQYTEIDLIGEEYFPENWNGDDIAHLSKFLADMTEYEFVELTDPGRSYRFMLLRREE